MTTPPRRPTHRAAARRQPHAWRTSVPCRSARSTSTRCASQAACRSSCPGSVPTRSTNCSSTPDGVLLTGSPSNVHPSHFGEDVHNLALPLDPERDEWTLPLTRRALDRGVPLLAICRGFQETNVALGGTLHQAVQEQPGKDDHRAPPDCRRRCSMVCARRARARRRAARVHPRLRHRAGEPVHGQGAKDLPRRARRGARAGRPRRGLLAPAAPGFNLCLQWHPEWRAQDNPVSMKLLRIRRRMPQLSRPAQPQHARARPGPLSLAAAREGAACRARAAGATPKNEQVEEKWTRANSVSATSSSGSTSAASPRSSAWCPTRPASRGQDPAAREFTEDRGMRLPEAVVAMGVTGEFPRRGRTTT